MWPVDAADEQDKGMKVQLVPGSSKAAGSPKIHLDISTFRAFSPVLKQDSYFS